MVNYLKERQKAINKYLDLFHATAKKHGHEFALSVVAITHASILASILQEDITKDELDKQFKESGEKMSESVFRLLQEGKKREGNNG